MEIWEFEVAVSSQQASVSLCSVCLPFLLCVPCECGMNVFMFCLSPLHAQNAVLIVDCQYFQCTGGYDDQVCNTCEPYYVTYDNCKDPSQFTLTIPYIMPNKTASVRMCVVLGCNDLTFQTSCLQGNFTVSLVSGHYYPKEIVVEVAYNFTSSDNL